MCTVSIQDRDMWHATSQIQFDHLVLCQSAHYRIWPFPSNTSVWLYCIWSSICSFLYFFPFVFISPILLPNCVIRDYKNCCVHFFKLQFPLKCMKERLNQIFLDLNKIWFCRCRRWSVQFLWRNLWKLDHSFVACGLSNSLQMVSFSGKPHRQDHDLQIMPLNQRGY